MYKIDPIEEGPDAGALAGIAGNLLFIIIGLILLVAVLVSAFRIMRSASSPLEEISSFDDYEYTQGSGFGSESLPGAPELPSADKVANSMYGGTKEIFQQPPPPLPIPQEEEPEEAIEEAITDDVNEHLAVPSDVPPGVPPVPESGLPDGWSMDQWIHYGQAWLDQQKQE